LRIKAEKLDQHEAQFGPRHKARAVGHPERYRQIRAPDHRQLDRRRAVRASGEHGNSRFICQPASSETPRLTRRHSSERYRCFLPQGPQQPAVWRSKIAESGLDVRRGHGICLSNALHLLGQEVTQAHQSVRGKVVAESARRDSPEGAKCAERCAIAFDLRATLFISRAACGAV